MGLSVDRRTILAATLGGAFLAGCKKEDGADSGPQLREVGKVPTTKGDIPTLAGDVVVTRGENASSVFLDAATLKPLWRRDESVRAFDGGFIAVGERQIVALEARTGAVRWRSAPISDSSRRLSLLHVADGVVAVLASSTSSVDDQVFVALDLASGRLLWSRAVPDDVALVGRTLLVGGTALLDSHTGAAVKSPLDLRECRPIDWKWAVSDAVETHTQSDAKGTLRVVDPVSGKTLLDPGFGYAGYGYVQSKTQQQTLMGAWFLGDGLWVQVAGQPAHKTASTHSDQGNVVAVVNGVIWCDSGQSVRPFDMEGRPVAGSARGTLVQASDKFVLMEEIANDLTGERRHRVYAMP